MSAGWENAIEHDREPRESLSDALRERYGEGVDPQLRLEQADDASGSARLHEVIERLQSRSPDVSRYRVRSEIARGGMGIIYKVWDEDLHRSLAKKVLLEDGRRADAPDGTPPRTVSRFLEEAQVTAQLDHPGIIPVHELGLDRSGGLYFTMRYVRGRDFRTYLRAVRQQTDGWTPTRALGVLLRVCETMAFAHTRGVIHRDLKPANVMVGRFGEVYVMDWGLARVLDRPDGRDLRPRDAPNVSDTSLHTERHHAQDDGSDSPLYTMDGDVIGTPAYMPPEQARGDVHLVGPGADVYAMGAMLYQLISDRIPFVPAHRRISARAIWSRLLDGPPTPVGELAPDAPEELVAMCEKAMARNIADRYASMEELADDLRAYLENRVVRAHRTGAMAELRKWIRRNRLAASAIVAGLIVSLAAAGTITWQSVVGERRALRFIDQIEIPALAKRAKDLWPIHPDSMPAMELWLEDVDAALLRIPTHRVLLAGLPGNDAMPREPLQADKLLLHDKELSAQLETTEDLVEKLPAIASKIRGDLADPASDPARRATREREVRTLETEILHVEALALQLRGEATALTRQVAATRLGRRDLQRTLAVVDTADYLLPPARVRVAARLEQARALRQETILTVAEAWRAAIESIADESQCPLYAGLRIEPQLGLVPLRRNEADLWEFWHWLSGKRPTVEGDSLRPGGDSAIVFILVPGGSFLMGSPAEGEDADPRAGPNEHPPLRVELEPYFLAKYEVTQGQWRRAHEGGANPSHQFAGASYDDRLHPVNKRLTLAHPVEMVSYQDARSGLARWNLELPTEAQWENAARGGVSGPFANGEALLGRVNFADASLASAANRPDPKLPDDGWFCHAPVDAFPGDALGFHNLLDNVSEWCRDWYVDDYESPVVNPGSGQLEPGPGDSRQYRAVRGGNFQSPLSAMRPPARTAFHEDERFKDLGFRPARPLRQGRRSR